MQEIPGSGFWIWLFAGFPSLLGWQTEDLFVEKNQKNNLFEYFNSDWRFLKAISNIFIDQLIV